MRSLPFFDEIDDGLLGLVALLIASIWFWWLTVPGVLLVALVREFAPRPVHLSPGS